MIFFWQVRKRAEIQAAAEAALMDTDDVRGVGALLEALLLGDRSLRLRAEQALLRLLPRLQGSDADIFNGEQRECLSRALSDRNSHLVLAVLKALEQIGDEAELPLLQRMSYRAGSSPEETRIRDAARACLPFVEARALQHSIPATLLRPAKEPIHAEQLLLASQAPGVPLSSLRRSERHGPKREA